MPNVYTVQLTVNVPGLAGGDKTVTQTNIQAADITAAIAQARASIIIEAIQVQRTAVLP